MHVFLSSTVCLLYLLEVIFASQAEHKLINRLFSHYDKRVRPSKEANEAVKLHVDNIRIKRLTHINENDSTIDISFWIGFAWNETLLSWDPSSYDGVKRITVRANEIWTPDIMLFSGWGVIESTLRDSQEQDVLISSSGLVRYYPSVKLILPCLNVTADGQLQCNFGLGSGILTTDVLNIIIVKDTMATKKYVIDPKYEVGKTSLEHKVIRVPSFNEDWELIVGRINLKKKHESF